MEGNASNDFLADYMKYGRLGRNLKNAQMSALMKKGYSKESAQTLLEGIRSAKFTSRGYEKSPETERLDSSIQDFFNEHPGFLNELMRLRRLISAKVKKMNPGLHGSSLNNAVRSASDEFFKWKGPTKKNLNNKRAVLNNLKLMPPQGLYPGGTDYLAAKENFNRHRGGTRKRK